MSVRVRVRYCWLVQYLVSHQVASNGYRFLFRQSLFQQFIFGRKSIHASDVRNCHCTFGVTLYTLQVHMFWPNAHITYFPAYCRKSGISQTFPAYPHYVHIFPAYFRSLLAHIWAYSEYFSHIFPACTQRIFGK